MIIMISTRERRHYHEQCEKNDHRKKLEKNDYNDNNPHTGKEEGDIPYHEKCENTCP